MRPVTQNLTSATTSPPVVVDYIQVPFAVGIGVISTGANTYKVQHTFEDPFDSTITPTWFDNIDGPQTASADFNYAFPVRAVRLNCSVYAAPLKMVVIQGVGA